VPARSDSSATLVIESVKTERHLLTILGTRPLICARMSQKARNELLLPAGRKTAADKQSSLKHNPVEEFQASPYLLSDSSEPTLIALMSSAFKGAMMTAAVDLPGTKRAQIGRLVFVENDYVPVYGEPQLFMSVTRSADINRTPDIRTRAIIPEWACQISVSFVSPMLNLQGIVNLLSAGGVTAGVGDWRPEKGKGTYGQFEVVNATDPRFTRIQATWGRAAQEKAIANPEPYDSESAEMLNWFGVEARKRGKLV